MIGFTRNSDRADSAGPNQGHEERLDFEKIRADMLTADSGERREAYDDYKRGHRSF